MSKDTISHWVKQLLQELTLKPFQPTALVALISKGCEFSISVEQIVTCCNILQKHLPSFYNKSIETKQTQTSFVKELLDNVFKND